MTPTVISRRTFLLQLIRKASFLVMVAGLASQAASASELPIFTDGFEAADIPASDGEAARFLQQATFGPTLEDIAHLRQVGYSAWIDEQLQMPPSFESAYLDWIEASTDETVYANHRVEAWFQHAMGGPSATNPALVHRDQLRQRVAFALSEILVVSDRLAAIGRETRLVTDYYDLLIAHALGDYRVLLEEVTLHPAMGIYLSMFRNRKPDAGLNIRPDENYAREVMQLFSIGLWQLAPDGSPVLVDDAKVPTYSQHTIRGFAHVFTGWNWSGCDNPATTTASADLAEWMHCQANYTEPMAPFDAFHDAATDKQLLIYPNVSLPAGMLLHGGNAEAELDAALDNIAHHPNVGPYIGRQLIQRLVTSNPSPAYVARVAAVFDADSAGQRGNLAAVVRAILLDDEARNGPVELPATFGKPREPLLKLTHLWRAMDAASPSSRYAEWYPEYSFSQAPLRAPSVFNFFRPNFSPADLVAPQLAAPELQLATDSGLTAQSNGIGEALYYAVASGDPLDVRIDLQRDLPLAADPAAAGQLIDRYDVLFLGGRMSPLLRQTLTDHLAQIAPSNPNHRRQRVQDALYLIFNSPEYEIQK